MSQVINPVGFKMEALVIAEFGLQPRRYHVVGNPMSALADASGAHPSMSPQYSLRSSARHDVAHPVSASMRARISRIFLCSDGCDMTFPAI